MSVADTELLVDVQGLEISFPAASNQPIVQGVDLAIHVGECVALVGESGSGKSLTARALLDLAGSAARVDAHRFHIAGRDARAFSDADWRRLRGTFGGLVMQDALVSLDPLRTIGQEVGEVLHTHGPHRDRATIATRTLDTLTRVGMPDPAMRAAQYAHQLSGGLRQRALIAAAIAAGPALIIADEPTTALDPAIQQQVLQVLADRVREGAGLLLISHDLAVVASLADRVIVMREGRVVETDRTTQVLNAPQHPYTRQLLAAIPSTQSRGQRLSSARLASDGTSGRAHGPAIERDALPPRRAIGREPVLEVDRVSKYYRHGRAGLGTTALDGVSFSVAAGEIVGIIGASGSGKSTCAKVVLGLIEPDEGEVRLLGSRWSGVSEACRRALRRMLQYIPQDPLSSFDPRHQVVDVIAENLPALRKAERVTRVVALLRQVGLESSFLDRYPRTLSGGQRQRVAIARALAADPEIIVCDEPVSALDISVQAQVLDLLAEIQASIGTALLFISHDHGVIQHIADRVLVFEEGRIVADGPVDAVFADVALAPLPPVGRRSGDERGALAPPAH